MARELRGKPVADAICEGLVPRIEALASRGVIPTLAIVRVGNREDDLSYERAAIKRCEGLGIAVRNYVLPDSCTQEDLLAAVTEINQDSTIHGCLIFRPLPSHLDDEELCETLLSSKDIDGITPGSIFGVFANEAIGFPPCTAAACIEVLKYYGVALEGARVAVVGRSMVVGKPVSMMLQVENATVTMCHTRTRDLPAECQAADILVVAAGHIGTVGASAVRAGQTVIDVGINWCEEDQKLVGDVAYDEVEPIVDAITPVPGGVGSVTTAILASHTVKAAECL